MFKERVVMRLKVASVMILALLLVGMLSVPFNIHSVGSETLFDTTPPTINILSPENRTYYIPLLPPGDFIIFIYPPPPPQTHIPLNFTVDETTSWIGYSLNGQANVTIFGNTTLVGLLFGTYSVLIYANDTYGNMGSSETVYFTVKILGDMNSDGIIDIIDLVIIALAFGSASEDDPLTPWDETLDWNPDADLNKDGLVDIVDLVMVVIHFGETW